MGVHSSGLCLLAQLSLLSCFIYWGGGAGESLPPLARPCAAPEHRLAVCWCCHLLALGRSSASLSCLPVVLGLGGTEKVSQLFCVERTLDWDPHLVSGD